MISSNDIVACICEGNSEKYIIEILLEQNNLIFDRDQLLDSKILTGSYRKPKVFTDHYLTLDYGDSNLVILVIQDNCNPGFFIKDPYNHQVNGNYLVITSPEIEMLMIHALNLFDEFQKVKSIKKPCEFLSDRLQVKQSKLKSKDYIYNFYSKYDLVNSIKLHKSKSSKLRKDNYLFLNDIIKDS